MTEATRHRSTLQRLRARLGRRTLHALLAALLTLLAWADGAHWHLLEALDNRVGDALLHRHAAQRTPPPDVVLVDIDQNSLMDPQMLELAGTWSWPRAIHAELLTALAAHGPRAIVLDLILSPPDRLHPENDAALAAALRDERIFVPMILMPESTQQAPLALAPEVMGIRRGPQARPDARYGIDAPIALPPELWRTGYINFIKDADGLGRSIELGREVQGWWLPHIVGRVADWLQLPRPGTPAFRLHWYGRSFTRIPYAQAYLAALSEGQALPFDPAGKIIIVGATASGLLDFVPTPVAATMPGPFVLATALANLQDGDWLREAPRWLSPALALTLVLAIAAAFMLRLSPLWPAALLGTAAVASMAASALLLGHQVYWVPTSALAMGALALLSFGLLSSRLEMAQRHHVQAMFSRFVDPRIVQDLSEAQQVAQAEVSASREVTVLFSDIRGFTSLSEHRQPEEIVALLNRYFEMQVEVIFRHGGTLDKFIGDAIMAFWGAPMAQGDHAERAVRAALGMSEALERFCAEVARELPGTRFEIGIGIHSGPAVVGFLGTARRLDYTAIGDTVNLASRIEGCTKGVARILVSEATRELCGERLAFAGHGAFSVKGREQQVLLYEPLPTMAATGTAPGTGGSTDGGEP
ncbi:adenylate/guanylate cyclase domain-containing protein [Comamonas flocculans]|uniref:Adenylate/guanylate cyclase domain-containing protein n=1 Tax=Comamonas flocculans TaxID=2597701 RepID=A0A5B8RXI1_9BURK|nr:adenylate/guanylate cyclase domain-containing protein [Comamonas flocculans]QEA14210.1 adenylate/guanylate cyclase domain-containing protein [Comamonas flocculans]